jgi:hypothetical protein
MVAAAATAKLPATTLAQTVEDLVAALQAQMDKHLFESHMNFLLYGTSVIEWINEPPFVRCVPPSEWDGLILGQAQTTQISLASDDTRCLTDRPSLKSIQNMSGDTERI